VPVTVVITGPDTLFSLSELGQYSAQSVPAFPDSAFKFASADSLAFLPAGRGNFTSMIPPLYPAIRTVRVFALLGQIDTVIDNQDLSCPSPPPCAGGDCPPPPPCYVKATHALAWRHAGSKDVVLTQKVVRLQLRCPIVHACDTLSAGAVWSVWVDGFDALNHPVAGLAGVDVNPAVSASFPAIATFGVRDSSIATVTPVGVRASSVVALKAGATWVVASRGALLDSVRLVVH
jgi:hypothetical protein